METNWRGFRRLGAAAQPPFDHVPTVVGGRDGTRAWPADSEDPTLGYPPRARMWHPGAEKGSRQGKVGPMRCTRAPLSALVFLAVSACLLGACSSGPSASRTTTPRTSSTTSAPPSSTSTSSVTTTTAGVTTCQISGLHVSLTGAQGAAGTQELTYALTDSATVTCTTFGYPGMLLLGASGTPLPTTVDRGGDLSFETVQPSTVRLTPGETAYFNVGYTDVTTGGTSCYEANQVEITPPTNTTHATLPAPASMDVCDNGTLHVSAVFSSTDAAATQTTAG
jgi:hypothetical protein